MRSSAATTSQTANELLELLQKYGSGTTFDRWLTEKQMDVTRWVPHMVDVYRSHEPCIMLHDGVGELLIRLRQRYRLGIVTDGFPRKPGS